MAPRTLLLLAALSPLLACGDKDAGTDSAEDAESDTDTDTDADTDTDTDTDVDTLPDEDELYGTYPDAPLAAPDFQATNRDNTGRAREDLLGHPTVMWFFPAAATAG